MLSLTQPPSFSPSLLLSPVWFGSQQKMQEENVQSIMSVQDDDMIDDFAALPLELDSGNKMTTER